MVCHLAFHGLHPLVGHYPLLCTCIVWLTVVGLFHAIGLHPVHEVRAACRGHQGGARRLQDRARGRENHASRLRGRRTDGVLL